MTDHPETEIQFIRRMIAMLLTLAGIAERAADRSYPVRVFLLWVLRRAETAAQDFVGVEDLWAGTIHGSAPQDALDLADSLRGLAAFLRDDLKHESLFQGWWRDGGSAAGGESPVTPIIRAIEAILAALAPRRAPLSPDVALRPRLDSS